MIYLLIILLKYQFYEPGESDSNVSDSDSDISDVSVEVDDELIEIMRVLAKNLFVMLNVCKNYSDFVPNVGAL